MKKITSIEVKWVCGLLEHASRELVSQAKEAERSSNLAPQMMRLKAEQYADIAARLRGALEQKSKRIEIKY